MRLSHLSICCGVEMGKDGQCLSCGAYGRKDAQDYYRGEGKFRWKKFVHKPRITIDGNNYAVDREVGGFTVLVHLYTLKEVYAVREGEELLIVDCAHNHFALMYISFSRLWSAVKKSFIKK